MPRISRENDPRQWKEDPRVSENLYSILLGILRYSCPFEHVNCVFSRMDDEGKVNSLVSCCKTKQEKTVAISYLLTGKKPWCIQPVNANHLSIFTRVNTQTKTFRPLILHAHFLRPRSFLSIVRLSFVQRNSVFYLAFVPPIP